MVTEVGEKKGLEAAARERDARTTCILELSSHSKRRSELPSLPRSTIKIYIFIEKKG